MKTNIIRSIVLLGAVLFSCNELDEKFYNPDEETKPDIVRFFTGALQSSELFRPDYGYYYHTYRQLNKATGIGMHVGLIASPSPWIIAQDWSGPSFYNQTYTKASVDWVKNINAMQLTYEGLPEAEQTKYKVYFYIADILKAFTYQRFSDLYDDVPYSEAGGAYRGIFFPRYDDQDFIYKDVIENLKQVTTNLKDVTLTDTERANFAFADIINKGDLQAWMRFANSLRLRMAMRLSVVDPAYARSVVEALTAENAAYVEENKDVVGIEELNKALAFSEYWPRGFDERGFDMNAPRLIMQDIFGFDGTNANDVSVDPRLKVVFQPNMYEKYVPVPEFGDVAQTVAFFRQQGLTKREADHVLSGGYGVNWAESDANQVEEVNGVMETLYTNRLLVSRYNRTTYLNFSSKFPRFTPTETYLLLAEAELRFPGSTGVDVATAYRKAIELSIDYYYTRNNSNTYGPGSTPPLQFTRPSYQVQPDAAKIAAFLDWRTGYFTALDRDAKIKEIFYQKLAHLNVFDIYEVWSEARRLRKDYGLLLKPINGKAEWIERLPYPPNEATSNPDNFAKVAAKNNNSTPVWWTGRTQ